MKNIVAGFLDRFGLELRSRGRTVTSLQSYPPTGTSGKIVELIGTRGVGKTTMLREVRKDLKDSWFFQEDLRSSGPMSSHSDSVESLHRDILFRRHAHLKRTATDSWGSVAKSQQVARTLYNSLMIQAHEFPRGFFLDEGLVKSFPYEIMAIDPDKTAPLWRNRAFIYMRARDPEIVAARRRKRVATRALNGTVHRTPPPAELRARIEEDNRIFDRIFERAEAFGCPTVILYAEESTADNVQKVLELERRLNAG